MILRPKFYRIRYKFPRNPDEFRVGTDEEAVVFARAVKEKDVNFEALEVWYGNQRDREIPL